MKTPRAATPLAALAALLAGALPFAVGTTAWPEIVTPAWFVTQGVRLYDGIFFPHTPLLILLTALLGGTLGFSAGVLRAIPALALAASGVLLVLGTRRRGASLTGPVAGLFAGVPFLVLLTVYAEGPALWPEPMLAPLALAGVLLLEHFERGGKARVLFAAGLAFGTGILVKQTFAWCAFGAFLWLVLGRPRRGRKAALFGAAVALPYGVFAVAWGLAFRTLAHLRWTLVLPVFSRHSGEIAAPPGSGDLFEAVWLFLPFAAFALLSRRLGARRFRSPAALAALGCAGMAWPRWGLLHLATMTALSALMASRACLVAAVVVRRASRASRSRASTILTAVLAAGVALLLVFLGVGVLGAGPLALDRVGSPVHFWDDSTTRAAVREVQGRVARGGTMLVFGAPHQTLYPLTGTLSPGGFYVNPSFWYYLNKDGIDARLVAAMRASPGLPILFREPVVDADRIRETAVYAFVKSETHEDGRAGEAHWRVVPAGSR